jgi:hypothetical protein
MQTGKLKVAPAPAVRHYTVTAARFCGDAVVADGMSPQVRLPSVAHEDVPVLLEVSRSHAIGVLPY